MDEMTSTNPLVQHDPETGETIMREVVDAPECGEFTKKTEPVPLPDPVRRQFEMMLEQQPDNETLVKALEEGITEAGDAFTCVHHLAEAMGCSEGDLARLALRRDEVFKPECVDTLLADGYTITRNECDRDWFGRELWPYGEVVSYLQSPDVMALLVDGLYTREGTVDEGREPNKHWGPDDDMAS